MDPLKMTAIKNFIPKIKKLIFCFFTIALFQITNLPGTNAQYPGFNELTGKHRKGEVNYAVTEAILSRTEENHIPIRGHNIS